MSTSSTTPAKRFHLFGYPIAHSAAPSLHNCIFEGLGSANRYERWSTSKVDQAMMDELRDDGCGGSAVTMPIKSAVIPFLDEISPESKATGAVNTVVKVKGADGKVKLIGTNTDILGVRNALLSALRAQFPTQTLSISQSYAPTTASGLIVGGGATTKSAVHALHTLGLSPIFLINRDPAEVKLVVDTFPQLELIHLKDVETVDRYLGGKGAEQKPPLLMITGAIPAISPTTPAERLVYTVIAHLLTIPYTPSLLPSLPSTSLPYPTTRLYLEMAYKPRNTPLLKIATALGWQPVGGINAMIEQGLAQQRMWLVGDASYEVACGESIGKEVEERARRLVEEMKDVVVVGEEVDRGL